MSLRLNAIAILNHRGEPISYRELTDLLWSTHPELKQRQFDLYKTEVKARHELRIQLGNVVKKHPETFTATLSDGLVLVGLAASDESNL